TITFFAEGLSKLITERQAHISIIPSSYQAHMLAIKYGLPMTNLDINPIIDITVDGADEVDKDLNLTKGGGGALLQEKIVASASKNLVIIVDESKLVEALATNFLIPIEVLPFSIGMVRRKLLDMGITPILREAERKMGPLVTDNGNFIFDLKFPEPISDPASIDIQLKMIPGIIETGLFVNMTDEVHVGTNDRSYIIKKK
ncbi:MAG TPA: ribose 5-phosphate isomerase A, partial [Armatimonadetes bacterium]|nr:ribose 5-phosphate isomerase A [Armatimonadota bacterium]